MQPDHAKATPLIGRVSFLVTRIQILMKSRSSAYAPGLSSLAATESSSSCLITVKLVTLYTVFAAAVSPVPTALLLPPLVDSQCHRVINPLFGKPPLSPSSRAPSCGADRRTALGDPVLEGLPAPAHERTQPNRKGHLSCVGESIDCARRTPQHPRDVLDGQQIYARIRSARQALFITRILRLIHRSSSVFSTVSLPSRLILPRSFGQILRTNTTFEFLSEVQKRKAPVCRGLSRVVIMRRTSAGLSNLGQTSFCPRRF